MDEREIAVMATSVITAMKTKDPKILTPWIEKIEATPWHPELSAVLCAVRYELYRQKNAKKNK